MAQTSIKRSAPGLFFQQRQVGRAGADRIEHAQHALDDGGRRWPRCSRLQQTLEDDVQAPPPRLIQSAIGSRVAIGFQQAARPRRFRRPEIRGSQFLHDIDGLRRRASPGRRLAVSCAGHRARRTPAPRIAAPRCRVPLSMRASASGQSGIPMFTHRRARSTGSPKESSASARRGSSAAHSPPCAVHG
jgi:hypothetical protein